MHRRSGHPLGILRKKIDTYFVSQGCRRLRPFSPAEKRNFLKAFRKFTRFLLSASGGLGKGTDRARRKYKVRASALAGSAWRTSASLRRSSPRRSASRSSWSAARRRTIPLALLGTPGTPGTLKVGDLRGSSSRDISEMGGQNGSARKHVSRTGSARR